MCQQYLTALTSGFLPTMYDLLSENLEEMRLPYEFHREPKPNLPILVQTWEPSKFLIIWC